MNNSRFTEQQIIKILKEPDAGMKVQDLCRQYGGSLATYYKWKSKYGDMEASDIKRMREVKAENGKPEENFRRPCTQRTAL